MKLIGVPEIPKQQPSKLNWVSQEHYHCGFCKDSGAVQARPKAKPADRLVTLHNGDTIVEPGIPPGPFAFQCDCQAGRSKRYAFPRWVAARREDWEMVA